MEWKQLEVQFNTEYQKTLVWYSDELDKIRSGRINPNIFNSINVVVYGDNMKLNQIANIQLMDARTVLIKPYDRSCIKDINTAITNSNMGVSPQTNPDSIKIVFPAQTEENRKLNVKKAKEYLEQEKIKIKNIRQAVKKTIDALTGISEDIIKNFNESLDKYTKKINLEVETIFNNKQVELMKL